MVPYSRTIRATVTAGQDNVIELPAPVRGLINHFCIYQVGASEAFTARVFTAERPAGAEDQLSDVDDENGIPAEAFAATAVMTGVGGKFESYDTRQGYVSNELAQQGRRQSSLWLRLTPSGSGAKNYAITYTVLVPEMV